jgi:uncharacterized protein YbjT (DUF2867 family)
MKIVIAGGHGLVGSKIVARLTAQGHDAIAVSRRSGVNTMTGEGLDTALADSDVLIDATNAPDFDEPVVSDFFALSTLNMLRASVRAGIRHYVALSVVGARRLPASAYFRAKDMQERLVLGSEVPHTVVQATQFYEFMANIIPPGQNKDPVHLPGAHVQPVAAADVAQLIAEIATKPQSSVVQIAGPESFRLNELVQWVMYSYQDYRPVIVDDDVAYYGAPLEERALMADQGAIPGSTIFKDWLDGYLSGSIGLPAVHHPHPMR